MKNSLVLLAVVLSVAAFAGMMRIKTDVQTMDRERMKLVLERAQLRETKRVLEAEWALLASPERLARLVQARGYVAASSLDVVPLVGPVVAVSPASVSASVLVSEAGVLASATAEVSPAGVDSGAVPLATVISATERE